MPPTPAAPWHATHPFVRYSCSAFLGGSASRRELLSGRTDGDIQRADFLCGRRASHSIRGPLRQRRDADEQDERERARRRYANPLVTLPSLPILQG